MTTSYPAAIDTFTNPAASDTMDGSVGGPAVEHDLQHDNINDAVAAIETTIGTTGNFKFAPVDSPHLTGLPTAPTPEIGDNTTLIATTDFVQVAFFIQNFAGIPWGTQFVVSNTTSYAPLNSDRGKVIEMNSSSALNLTLNPSIFAAGDWFDVRQAGAGAVTFVPGVGVTIDSLNGVITTSGQWATVRVRFRSATEAVISGDLF